ncbi:MAG TPA: hypothetical protein VFC80_05495 [Sphaerochaeta sp.]|nr:hypothetical protein [Sphaerochaeta sp.]
MAEEKKEKRQRKRGDRRSRGRRKSSRGSQKRKREDSLLPKIRVGTHRSKLPPLPVKSVVEPNETCGFCQEPIDLIASAVTHPDGGFAHFDCVLKQLASTRSLAEGERISYIGRGMFAVISEANDGTITIVEEIIWEEPKQFAEMKKYVEAQKE